MSHLLEALDWADKEDEAKKLYVKKHENDIKTLDDVEKFTNNNAINGEGNTLSNKKPD